MEFYPSTYKPLLEVYGNCDSFNKQLYFLAIRFKKPVLLMKQAPEEIPKEAVVLLEEKTFPLKVPISTMVFFGSKIQDPINHIGKSDLLLSLFPIDAVLHHTFSHEFLFVVSFTNPFEAIWKKNQRSSAFQALYTLAMVNLICPENVSPMAVALFRHFNSEKVDFNKFSSWIPLAHSMLALNLPRRRPYFYPTPYFGNIVHKIIQRSEKHVPGPLPPDEFYTCEIMLEKGKTMGILFRNSPEFKLQYVSPMVVSNPGRVVRDVNGELCENWFPLYRNKQTWEQVGMTFYVHSYFERLNTFKQIISRLHTLAGEKYRFIYMDFENIAHILLGDEAKWFLRNQEEGCL